jgi:hypothetical protein
MNAGINEFGKGEGLDGFSFDINNPKPGDEGKFKQKVSVTFYYPNPEGTSPVSRTFTMKCEGGGVERLAGKVSDIAIPFILAQAELLKPILNPEAINQGALPLDSLATTAPSVEGNCKHLEGRIKKVSYEVKLNESDGTGGGLVKESIKYDGDLSDKKVQESVENYKENTYFTKLMGAVRHYVLPLFKTSAEEVVEEGPNLNPMLGTKEKEKIVNALADKDHRSALATGISDLKDTVCTNIKKCRGTSGKLIFLKKAKDKLINFCKAVNKEGKPLEDLGSSNGVLVGIKKCMKQIQDSTLDALKDLSVQQAEDAQDDVERLNDLGSIDDIVSDDALNLKEPLEESLGIFKGEVEGGLGNRLKPPEEERTIEGLKSEGQALTATSSVEDKEAYCKKAIAVLESIKADLETNTDSGKLEFVQGKFKDILDLVAVGALKGSEKIEGLAGALEKVLEVLHSKIGTIATNKDGELSFDDVDSFKKGLSESYDAKKGDLLPEFGKEYEKILDLIAPQEKVEGGTSKRPFNSEEINLLIEKVKSKKAEVEELGDVDLAEGAELDAAKEKVTNYKNSMVAALNALKDQAEFNVELHMVLLNFVKPDLWEGEGLDVLAKAFPLTSSDELNGAFENYLKKLKKFLVGDLEDFVEILGSNDLEEIEVLERAKIVLEFLIDLERIPEAIKTTIGNFNKEIEASLDSLKKAIADSDKDGEFVFVVSGPVTEKMDEINAEITKTLLEAGDLEEFKFNVGVYITNLQANVSKRVLGEGYLEVDQKFLEDALKALLNFCGEKREGGAWKSRFTKLDDIRGLNLVMEGALATIKDKFLELTDIKNFSIENLSEEYNFDLDSEEEVDALINGQFDEGKRLREMITSLRKKIGIKKNLNLTPNEKKLLGDRFPDFPLEYLDPIILEENTLGGELSEANKLNMEGLAYRFSNYKAWGLLYRDITFWKEPLVLEKKALFAKIEWTFKKLEASHQESLESLRSKFQNFPPEMFKGSLILLSNIEKEEVELAEKALNLLNVTDPTNLGIGIDKLKDLSIKEFKLIIDLFGEIPEDHSFKANSRTILEKLFESIQHSAEKEEGFIATISNNTKHTLSPDDKPYVILAYLNQAHPGLQGFIKEYLQNNSGKYLKMQENVSGLTVLTSKKARTEGDKKFRSMCKDLKRVMEAVSAKMESKASNISKEWGAYTNFFSEGGKSYFSKPEFADIREYLQKCSSEEKACFRECLEIAHNINTAILNIGLFKGHKLESFPFCFNLRCAIDKSLESLKMKDENNDSAIKFLEIFSEHLSLTFAEIRTEAGSLIPEGDENFNEENLQNAFEICTKFSAVNLPYFAEESKRLYEKDPKEAYMVIHHASNALINSGVDITAKTFTEHTLRFDNLFKLCGGTTGSPEAKVKAFELLAPYFYNNEGLNTLLKATVERSVEYTNELAEALEGCKNNDAYNESANAGVKNVVDAALSTLNKRMKKPAFSKLHERYRKKEGMNIQDLGGAVGVIKRIANELMLPSYAGPDYGEIEFEFDDEALNAEKLDLEKVHKFMQQQQDLISLRDKLKSLNYAGIKFGRTNEEKIILAMYGDIEDSLKEAKVMHGKILDKLCNGAEDKDKPDLRSFFTKLEGLLKVSGEPLGPQLRKEQFEKTLRTVLDNMIPSDSEPEEGKELFALERGAWVEKTEEGLTVKEEYLTPDEFKELQKKFGVKDNEAANFLSEFHKAQGNLLKSKLIKGVLGTKGNEGLKALTILYGKYELDQKSKALLNNFLEQERFKDGAKDGDNKANLGAVVALIVEDSPEKAKVLEDFEAIFNFLEKSTEINVSDFSDSAWKAIPDLYALCNEGKKEQLAEAYLKVCNKKLDKWSRSKEVKQKEIKTLFDGALKVLPKAQKTDREGIKEALGILYYLKSLEGGGKRDLFVKLMQENGAFLEKKLSCFEIKEVEEGYTGKVTGEKNKKTAIDTKVAAIIGEFRKGLKEYGSHFGVTFEED